MKNENADSFAYELVVKTRWHTDDPDNPFSGYTLPVENPVVFRWGDSAGQETEE